MTNTDKHSKKRTGTHLLLVLITIAVLAAYNLTGRPLESLRSAEYQEWVDKIEAAYLQSEDGVSPEVSIHLFSESTEPKLDWKIDSTSSHNSPHQVLRILNLLEQARVFATSPMFQFSQPQDAIHIEVMGGSKKFQTALSAKEMQASSDTQLLLKLFQLYSSAD